MPPQKLLLGHFAGVNAIVDAIRVKVMLLMLIWTNDRTLFRPRITNSSCHTYSHSVQRRVNCDWLSSTTACRAT